MENIPYGSCQCGCGQPAPISAYSSKKNGYVAGEPRKFVSGHNSCSTPYSSQEYEEMDCGYLTVCWVWLRAKSKAGYGQKRIAGKLHYAHHLYYEQYVGPRPDNGDVDHLCSNPSCVNPEHLEAVSHTENMRRGKNTRLSLQDAKEIKHLRKSLGITYEELGRRFGISGRHASHIVNGVWWKDA